MGRVDWQTSCKAGTDERTPPNPLGIMPSCEFRSCAGQKDFQKRNKVGTTKNAPNPGGCFKAVWDLRDVDPGDGFILID